MHHTYGDAPLFHQQVGLQRSVIKSVYSQVQFYPCQYHTCRKKVK